MKRTQEKPPEIWYTVSSKFGMQLKTKNELTAYKAAYASYHIHNTPAYIHVEEI